MQEGGAIVNVLAFSGFSMLRSLWTRSTAQAEKSWKTTNAWIVSVRWSAVRVLPVKPWLCCFLLMPYNLYFINSPMTTDKKYYAFSSKDNFLSFDFFFTFLKWKCFIGGNKKAAVYLFLNWFCYDAIDFSQRTCVCPITIYFKIFCPWCSLAAMIS